MSSYTFPKALKELRIHFSQSGPHSSAVQSFLNKSYPALKKANQTTPILVREALGIEPVAYARFEYGKETKTSLKDTDVAAAIKSLIEKGA